MIRLTQTDTSGNWQAKGIPWKRLHEGATITKETRQSLYMCLCKLKDYEDCGMNPDQLESWQRELTDMAEHVCDDLCRYRHEAEMQWAQEELNEICKSCPVSACLGKLLELEEDDG